MITAATTGLVDESQRTIVSVVMATAGCPIGGLAAVAHGQIGHGLAGDRGKKLGAGVQPFGDAPADGGPRAGEFVFRE